MTNGVIKSIEYRVSGSGPGVVYSVVCDPRDGRVLACTCQDHQNRRRECKHMRAVATPTHAGLKPRVRFGPRDVATPQRFAIIRVGERTIVRSSREAANIAARSAAAAPPLAAMSDLYGG